MSPIVQTDRNRKKIYRQKDKRKKERHRQRKTTLPFSITVYSFQGSIYTILSMLAGFISDLNTIYYLFLQELCWVLCLIFKLYVIRVCRGSCGFYVRSIHSMLSMFEGDLVGFMSDLYTLCNPCLKGPLWVLCPIYTLFVIYVCKRLMWV